MIKVWEKQKYIPPKELTAAEYKNLEEINKPKDTIIQEIIKKTDIVKNKDGTATTTITEEIIKTNITKRINETAKKLKIENMEELVLDIIGQEE